MARNRFNTIISGTNVSGTQTSAAIQSQQGWLVTLQTQVDAYGGVLVLEVSNDPPNTLLTDTNGNLIPVNWAPVASQAVSGTASFYLGPITVCSLWLRASITGSSGTGNVTCNFVCMDQFRG